MKKCVNYLLIIIAAMLTACNDIENAQKGLLKNNDKFVTKNIKTICYLDSTDKDSPKYETNMSIMIMESQDKEREKKINNSILYTIFGYENISVKTAMDSFITNAHKEYYDLRPEYFNEKQINKNAEQFNFSYNIDTNIEYGRNNIINYNIKSTHCTGGTHCNSINTFINFDPQTGNEIKLNDIFKQNYEEFLNNRLTDALANKINANNRKEIIEKGYLTFSDIFPTENFILKKDSILFFYNCYDIAPYAVGTTTLGFTYEELHEIMK